MARPILIHLFLPDARLIPAVLYQRHAIHAALGDDLSRHLAFQQSTVDASEAVQMLAHVTCRWYSSKWRSRLPELADGFFSMALFHRHRRVPGGWHTLSDQHAVQEGFSALWPSQSRLAIRLVQLVFLATVSLPGVVFKHGIPGPEGTFCLPVHGLHEIFDSRQANEAMDICSQGVKPWPCSPFKIAA